MRRSFKPKRSRAICRVPPFEPRSRRRAQLLRRSGAAARAVHHARRLSGRYQRWPGHARSAKGAAGDLAAPARHVVHVGTLAVRRCSFTLARRANIGKRSPPMLRLQRICGWVPQAAAWSPSADVSVRVDQCSRRASRFTRRSDQRALIVDSRLRGSVAWRGAAHHRQCRDGTTDRVGAGHRARSTAVGAWLRHAHLWPVR